MTDRELLDRLRQGDREAFDAAFRAHYATLVGVAERIAGERAVAEELAQDVMLELWRRHETLVIDESLRAYLVRAVRNRALNHVRHERMKVRTAPRAAGETVSQPEAPSNVVEAEMEAALRDAVASLPERCREVFELSRGQGLRYAEIAAALGISVKTVEAQMGKALRVLRERLAPFLPGREA
ncbi:RNA polymerase sigma-70 factor [Longimicrobium sp.]|uniref:RNA polymerase sigma-70 factor n=1 Tax=Longimicrobium sp. TaxID=2029185 RepID=UPI002E36F4E9|nr:RNA polymerase sigma-70 factor [Longimicrobium sp.]HEX6042773.1 RNA polymerase sigma-70 factor [Longimicrobium sp.]